MINSGFFVLSPKCPRRIEGDRISWELEPLTGLASEGPLMVFNRLGVWAAEGKSLMPFESPRR